MYRIGMTAVAALCAASGAIASGYSVGNGFNVVVDSSINRIDGGNDEIGYSTVDYTHFYAQDDGVYSIDLLSWESYYIDDVYTNPYLLRGQSETLGWTDVNGDNESNYFDTYIYLFKDDGDLTADDLVAVSDDAGDWNTDVLGEAPVYGNGSSDGSIDGLDSYMEVLLEAGCNYILMVGAYNLSAEDALFGANREGDYYPIELEEVGVGTLRTDEYYETLAESGDYRATLTWQAIPAPGAAGLMGLLGLAGLRRRRH